MACTKRKYFPSKRQTETVMVTFNFEKALTSTETVDASEWSVEVEEGTDASPTTTMVIGSPIISGFRVSHLIGSGIMDVIYEIVGQATTSLGQVLEGTGLIQIRD